MLEVILQNFLQVGKLRFLIENEGGFSCLSGYGGTIESDAVLVQACKKLRKIKQPAPVAEHADEILKQYDYFVPIYHKSKALAFALIGDFNTTPEMLNNDLNFIQTLMNVIVVALENKKLFQQRLEAERFQREMELAVEVQKMLIPVRLQMDKSVEIGSKYLPHQNIGGDYFDFLRLNDAEFLWCIADVSGKGISAALLMANFQASLRAWATVEDDLATVVERLNHIVLKNTKGDRFITLFAGKYNESTGKLSYINAGHNPPILYCNGEAFPLKLGTTMIGAFDELPFINQGELDIEPGTLIFNYTDGLLDYDVLNTKTWNEDKLLSFVAKNGELSPDKFNQALMDHLGRIIKGKPIDDITVLTLRFL
jgi:sigma-B regulation protein RsbU (phosphoserine phosphatase)